MASGEPHLREGGCQNQVCDPELARALRPLLAPPCFAPPFNALGVSTICDVDMPNELALQIACLLDVGSLDALAGASTSWRAVSRAKEVEEALVRRWCAAATPEATRLDARSLCRSFERLTLAAAACEDGWDAVLWQAAALGCIHGVLLALERGARLEYSGGRREGTALWCAAKFDQVEVVALLHRAGANIETGGGINSESSPLWVAAQQGHARTVQYLLEHRADPNSRSRNGNPVLNVAVMQHDMGESVAVLSGLLEQMTTPPW
ncbi:hypothetical protein EMIHUDRAFT_437767 [Emiliania huxleyi CCMP1516]|uniref:F-box domain-containing protein n=2 Tax=Emiliania huxleyi TaxID=2903 RepID=A0A0D3II72_EMIH1|nr:hypothetical protein EMIHUDRAFT_437767 [Emiliania huxleyi CCMP1516]EOD10957.1 hypothetical protein EMIHUDRAFT_437767 [Emiliania huxleyi CCMP1516]|eukprot:XP_005763386.1 hypothetical protein EMIHUDRAFT_437767 [Emiliania huxleyi CCMP1516]